VDSSDDDEEEESEDEDSDSEDETSLEEEEDEEGELSLEDVTIAATKNLANLQNCKRHSTIFMVRPLLSTLPLPAQHILLSVSCSSIVHTYLIK